MQGWQKFEHLVARIHQVLGGGRFTIEQDVTLTEPSGAEHQIDVVLTPKGPFLGRILVSCKSSSVRVGMDHVREWADIVQHTGSAAGIIASPTGFTSGAIDLAKNPTRRVSLWVARLLTIEDFPSSINPTSQDFNGLRFTTRGRVPLPRATTFRVRPEDTRAALTQRRKVITVEDVSNAGASYYIAAPALDPRHGDQCARSFGAQVAARARAGARSRADGRAQWAEGTARTWRSGRDPGRLAVGGGRCAMDG